MACRLLLFLFYSVLSVQLFAQATTCEKAEKLVAKLKTHHIDPLQINDQWSQRVFNNFFTTLDPVKIYFSSEDIQKLQVYSASLDDNILNHKACAFVDVMSALFKKKIENYNAWTEKNLTKPFNYSEPETFDAVRLHSHSFVTSDRDLEIRWKHYLKYQILNRMSQESLADTLSKSLLDFEKIARQKIKNKEQQNNTAILKNNFENHITHAFLQAIATAYDPHTAYYSFEENEAFKTSLSQTDLSFGFALIEDEFGSIRFTAIVPGSPAWNSNGIHEDDLLISVETPDKAVMNAMDYSIDELEDFLDAYGTQTATFTLKKSDGKIKQVTLLKEKIQSVENTVSGIVLKGVKSIGYISLPSFYFDWKDETMADGCANDVAKAIIKLNKEKIEGLILDLRFNGGGSLTEALGLAGIFIDYGPFATYSETGQPLVTLKDQNKGTIYNGPLMLLVNGFSASASELLASTLQDYNRALVVGSRTFGKGTGQDIFPMAKPASINSKNDFVKITMLRIYRLNGKTYQHTGVIPHIMLPDITDMFELKESEYTYALPSDSITKKMYYTPFANLPVIILREKSQARVIQSAGFQRVMAVRKTLSNPIPVELKGYTSYLLEIKDFARDSISVFKANNTNFDDPLFAVDAFKKKMNDTLLLDIEASIYIQEAYQIMIDYITLQKK
jgi:carboxyl-terminal processing protease